MVKYMLDDFTMTTLQEHDGKEALAGERGKLDGQAGIAWFFFRTSG